MNNFFKMLLLVAVFGLTASAQERTLPALSGLADPPQRKHLRFVERVQEGNSTFQSQPMRAKAQRTSGTRGTILLSYDSALPDSVKTALEVAKNIWEAKLPTRQPVYIEVTFDPCEEDVAMIADVLHMGYEDGREMVFYPSALYDQVMDEKGSFESPDGYISLNSDLTWNCRYSADAEDVVGYNLTTMMMRGIARCLGFGSSLIDSGDSYMFSFAIPSSFDHLLHCGNRSLAEMEEEGQELAKAVTSGRVEALTPQSRYPIYSPNNYEPFSSLAYFDCEDSLLSYSLGEGDVCLDIDNATLEVLKALGWDLPDGDASIVCADIDETGIGSSYIPHTFSLGISNVPVTSYEWKYYLKNKSGEWSCISTATTPTFTIDKVGATDNLFVNLNGDLDGRIECEYTVGTTRFSASPLCLSLEQKPIILSIENIVEDRDLYSFKVSFVVNYRGADNVEMTVDEEYSPFGTFTIIQEPYSAHCKTFSIISLYWSWVTVTVRNQYGKVSETLEYEPFDPTAFIQSESSATNDVSALHASHVKVYDSIGTLLYEGPASNFSPDSLAPGIYVKLDETGEGNMITTKFLKK